MGFLMKIDETPISNRKQNSSRLLILNQNHGISNLGFTLNNYLFVSGEDIQRNIYPHVDPNFDFRYEFFKDGYGRWDSNEYDPDQILRNLETWHLVVANSFKPLNQKDLTQISEDREVQKLNFDSLGSWFYSVPLRFENRYSNEDLKSFLEDEMISYMDYLSEVAKRKKEQFKRSFLTSKLNPFESMSLLTQNLSEGGFDVDVSYDEIRKMRSTVEYLD